MYVYSFSLLIYYFHFPTTEEKLIWTRFESSSVGSVGTSSFFLSYCCLISWNSRMSVLARTQCLTCASRVWNHPILKEGFSFKLSPMCWAVSTATSLISGHPASEVLPGGVPKKVHNMSHVRCTQRQVLKVYLSYVGSPTTNPCIAIRKPIEQVTCDHSNSSKLRFYFFLYFLKLLPVPFG